MSKVKLYIDALNFFWKRDKKYNPYVCWIDLVLYFRMYKRLIKRCPTVLTIKALEHDWKEYKTYSKKDKVSRKEMNEHLQWEVGGCKNFKEFKNKKKILLRYSYDSPDESEEWIDEYSLAPRNKFGKRPYMTDILIPEKNLTLDVIKKGIIIYLKNNFNILIKEDDIQLIKAPKEKEIKESWERHCLDMDSWEEMRKKGEKLKIVMLDQPSKFFFGEDAKQVTIDGPKTEIQYEDGTKEVEYKPNFEVISKKDKNK